MVTRAHIALSPETLDALDRAASADRRTRSATVQIAVEAYLAQRAATTGESRLADLERLSNQHQGASMPIPDVDPTPPTVPGERPFGTNITRDESILRRVAIEAKMPAPRVSPPNRSHLTDAERQRSRAEFMKSHPNGKLLEGK